MLSFSVLGDTLTEVTKTRYPTISVKYTEKEPVTVLERTLITDGLITPISYNLTDIPTIPDIIPDISLKYDYIFSYQPINPLPNGDYVFIITSSDYVGNNVSQQQKFKVNVSFDITLLTPKTGISNYNPIDLRINTSNAMQGCKYITDSQNDYADITDTKLFFTKGADAKTFNKNPFDITFYVLEDEELSIYVLCNDTQGFTNNNFPKRITLMYDTSPPNISVYTIPITPITNSNYAFNLTAESLPYSKNPALLATKRDKINCKFSYSTSYPPVMPDSMNYNFNTDETYNEIQSVLLNSTSNPAITDETNYTFYVQCKNGAEDFSQIISYNVYINSRLGGIIESALPTGYVKTLNPTLNITTNRASSCSFTGDASGNFPEILKLNHLFTLFAQTQGDHTYHVLCQFPNAASKNTDIKFTIDTTPPVVQIVTLDPVCSLNQISGKINSTDTDIAKYQYTLMEDIQALKTGEITSTNNIKITGLHLSLDQSTYSLKILAIDKAGNIGPEENIPITVRDALTDITCLSRDKTLNLNDTDGDGVLAYLDCDDTNPNINPDINEICDNNIDDNCNAKIDCEDSSCFNTESCTQCTIENITESCGETTATCTPGVKTCQNGRWSVCTSEVGNCTVENTGNTELGTDTTTDSDGDGMPDSWETKYGLNPNDKKDAYLDKDNDGLTNFEEYQAGTDPTKEDTDGDGIVDGGERTSITNPIDKITRPEDSDNDGMDDVWETTNFGDLSHDGKSDTDNDGLTDFEEYIYNTNPNKQDTDGEGLKDGEEVHTHHTNPTKSDTDNDSYNDNVEIDAETDPLDPNDFPKESNTSNNTDSTTTSPETSTNLKDHIFGIIFLTLGLIMVFGSGGYILYKKYIKNRIEVNNFSQRQLSSQHSSVQGTLDLSLMTPEKREAVIQKQKSQNQKMQEMMNRRIELQNSIISKRKEEKISKRKSVLSAFDGDVNNKKEETKLAEKEKSIPLDINNSMNAKRLMEDIIKRQKEKKANKLPVKTKQDNIKSADEKLESIIQKETVFETLEKLGKSKTDEEVKTRLDILTHKTTGEENLEKINLKSHANTEDIDKLIEKQQKHREVFKELLEDKNQKITKHFKKSKK